MKSIENIINEKKVENFFDPHIDVKEYIDAMIDKWLLNVQSYNILAIYNDYDKLSLLRKCETIIYLLDKFSDDIKIHFIPYDDNSNDLKNVYYGYDLSTRLISAFNVIFKLTEIDTYDNTSPLKDGESIKDTVEDIKTKFYNLIDKYNKKYHEYIEKNNISDCSCCDCCCKCPEKYAMPASTMNSVSSY